MKGWQTAKGYFIAIRKHSDWMLRFPKKLLLFNHDIMKYIYYKLYQNLKSVKTNDTPATNAMILLSMIHMANIATLHNLLNHFFNIKMKLLTKDEVIAFAFSLGIIIYIFDYFLFYKKREEIYEKYKNESKLQSRIGYTILVLYIIGSAGLLYVIGSKYPL